MGTTLTTHLVLLGDSTFDNKFYVGKGNPSIIEQLKQKAEERGWHATSVAVDGHSMSHIPSQLERIPNDATHLFISIGGNDALEYMQRLNHEVKTVAEGEIFFNEILKEFEKDYLQMLEHVKSRQLPTTLCTLYRPNFENPVQKNMSEPGILAVNSIIINGAMKFGFAVIDFKSIFNDADDYANAIEPASQGGSKIVTNIFYLLDHHRFNQHITSIYSVQSSN